MSGNLATAFAYQLLSRELQQAMHDRFLIANAANYLPDGTLLPFGLHYNNGRVLRGQSVSDNGRMRVLVCWLLEE